MMGREKQRNGGMAEWRNSGMAEWRSSGMAEWRNGCMPPTMQKQEINRKVNRKLNCNGTGTKLHYCNGLINNYYMYAWMKKR